MSEHQKPEHKAAAHKPAHKTVPGGARDFARLIHAAAAAGPTPKTTDIPHVRPDNSQVGNPTTFNAADGYRGCVVLAPTLDDLSLEVVLYVDADWTLGVTWTPTATDVGTLVVIDLPIGFNIGNGVAISAWLAQYKVGGPTVPATGRP